MPTLQSLESQPKDLSKVTDITPIAESFEISKQRDGVQIPTETLQDLEDDASKANQSLEKLFHVREENGVMVGFFPVEADTVIEYGKCVKLVGLHAESYVYLEQCYLLRGDNPMGVAIMDSPKGGRLDVKVALFREKTSPYFILPYDLMPRLSGRLKRKFKALRRGVLKKFPQYLPQWKVRK